VRDWNWKPRPPTGAGGMGDVGENERIEDLFLMPNSPAAFRPPLMGRLEKESRDRKLFPRKKSEQRESRAPAECTRAGGVAERCSAGLD